MGPVDTSTIKVRSYILVRHLGSEDGKADTFWKATVVEIRKDLRSEIEYLLVTWLYAPCDLPCGRKAHHGKHELIVTNHMGVIETSSVVGSFIFRHWNEKNDYQTLRKYTYYSRQSFDVESKNFSVSRPTHLQVAFNLI